MPEPRPDREQDGYTPSSPVKRIIAWTGVVYMVGLVLLNLYPFFHGGAMLNGIAPLLVCPGAAGLAVICVWQLRQKDCPTGKRILLAVIVVLCAILLLMGLMDGLPALMAGFGR